MDTKMAKVAAHLRAKGSITPKEAYFLYRSMRLSDIIFKLRGKGWDIRTDMVSTRLADGGTESYARYVLEDTDGS